ncbi:MAG: hypothetical protein JW810_06665, partial [Sedimentisphaerales bacterium]|nr:hypothetical protein [Sedimentisphaerales bacterium]
ADTADPDAAAASGTTSTPAKSDRQKQYESVCGGLKSCRYKAKVNARGQVLTLFDLDKKIQDHMSGPITSGYIGGFQLAFLLSETNLRDYACCWLYSDMPIRQPEPQAKWLAVTPAETPQTAPVLAQKDFVLTGVSSADQQDWAEIAVKVAGPSKGTIPAYVTNNLKRRQPDMEIINLHGEGQTKLTLHDGQVRYWHEKITAEVQLAGQKYRQMESQSPERRRNRSFYVMEKTIEWVKP